MAIETYHCAEAIVTVEGDRVVKKRISKRYRVKELDTSLRFARMRSEAKAISQARRCGVRTPIILDAEGDVLVFERIYGIPLKNELTPLRLEQVGRSLAMLHDAGIVHGDLTTSNVLVTSDDVCLIDFGLSFFSDATEDFAVDIFVLLQTLNAALDEIEAASLKSSLKSGYSSVRESKAVFKRVKDIEKRRRYR